MPALSGIVEAISIKALNEPDRFGNLHRCSIKLGEDWVSWGTTKKPEISYKEGENYKTLQKGMEVEFMYVQNGDFKNIKKTSLAVISTEGAQASPPPSAPAQQQAAPAYKKPYVGGTINPATVGACLNLAIEVLGYTKSDFEDEGKLKEAILWHKTTFDRMMELYPTVEAGTKPEPKAKKAEEQMPLDLSDDDEI
jgi:hypothetical protein